MTTGMLASGVVLAAPAQAAVAHKTGCSITGTAVACWAPNVVQANAAHHLRVCAEGGALIAAAIKVTDTNTGVVVSDWTAWGERCKVVTGLYGQYQMMVTGRGRGWIQDY